MEGAGSDPTARRQPDDDGTGDLPAIVELGSNVDELIEAARDEIGELHLDDRTVAEHGGADGDADGAALGDGSVEDTVRPAGVQAASGAEGPLEGADVLAEHQHRLVPVHLLEQGLVDGVDVRG